MIRLPQNQIYKQLNLGDVFGDLWSSYNLSLSDEQGKLKVSPRFLVNTEGADIGTGELDVAPFAIIYNDTDSKWYVGAGDDTFIGDNLPSEAFALDTATGGSLWEGTATPDLAYFNGLIYGVSGELQRLDAGGADWDQIDVTGTPTGAPLIPFGATGRLYFKAGIDRMASINTAEVLVEATNTYALDLNDDTYTITCGKASADFIYLGTRAPQGQKARVHKWNGSSTAVSATYEIDAQAVLAMGIKDNSPILLDCNGVLRHLNGGNFVEVARLPFREGKPLRPLKGAQTTWLCHYNGLVVDKDKVLMLLNTTYADGTTDEKIPSGIWEYNEKNGLFHRGSLGTTKSGGSITDYGGQKVSAVGALAVAKVPDSTTNGTLLAGATIFTTATATKVAIFYDDSNNTLQKAGSFITSKIFSPNISDIWQKIYLRFRKFLNATDKIVIKYRTKEDEPTEATITYTSTTTFTVPTASFTTAPAVGDEVEIIQGIGAGRTAHITVVTTSAPNYAITVDETITGATTQTAKARFQTWKKIGSYNAQTDDFIKFPITEGNTSTWIQFKVWMLWTGKNELYDLTISNKVNEVIE